MAQSKPKREPNDLELLPPDEAKRRTDDVLRRMLQTPPDPHKPKKTSKSAKPAK